MLQCIFVSYLFCYASNERLQIFTFSVLKLSLNNCDNILKRHFSLRSVFRNLSSKFWLQVFIAIQKGVKFKAK